MAFVQKKLATSVLQNEKSNLKLVLEAVTDLELAQRSFKFLSQHGEYHKLNLAHAEAEGRMCADLLSQVSYMACP